jgi:DNA-binding IclR family transcriptional regulator
MLELLGRAEDAMSLAAVATQLKVPKSSALTLLRALVASEFCVVDNQGRYALGVRSFEVGAAYLRSMTPVRSVTPELRWLTATLGVTSHFAVLDREEVIYLAKHDPPDVALKLASSLGARLPAAVTAVGKAQLAYPFPADWGGPARPAVPCGSESSSSERLSAELQLVRERGYAVDEGEAAVAIRCVAAPLFNDRGCCGAIGVSYLLGGGPSSTVVVEAILEAAQRASDRLGGRLGGFLSKEHQR